MINNKWKDGFSLIEKYVFNFILNSRLKHYSYDYQNLSVKDYFIVPFLVIIPLKFELDLFFMNFSYKHSFRNKLYFSRKNFFGYFKRILLFYKYYYFQLSRKYFKTNLLSCDDK